MTTLTQKPRVAFQGERGAFSEEAAHKLLGHEIELVPRRTFADLYNSLDNGVADYLLAPVENSIAGVVQPSVDLLRSSSLTVLDEVQIKIEQHLIGCPGASFDMIETVQSHPVALAQCSRFLQAHPRTQTRYRRRHRRQRRRSDASRRSQTRRHRRPARRGSLRRLDHSQKHSGHCRKLHPICFAVGLGRTETQPPTLAVKETQS